MNFLYSEFNHEAINQLASELHISQLTAFLLHNRGVNDLNGAHVFMSPSLQAMHDPFLMKDMDLAVNRIQKALEKGEKILINGDEDVDGISSTIILMKTLQNLGGNVSYVIPNKKQDGIGIRKKFIDPAHATGTTLIITVDCGTTNFSQAEYAAQLGIDLIISDHHETLAELPRAIAIINPKRKDCHYPFNKLSGAGVAYKLSQAIAMRIMGISSSQWYSVQKDLLALAMLGTIGDRVPLIGENRIFVKYGIESIRKSNSDWIRVILDNHPSSTKTINMSALLTLFIPLLSAGESKNGRNISCELLLSDDAEIARTWASELYASSQDWFLRARNAFGRIKSNLSFSKSLNLLLLVERETEIDVLSYCASKLKDMLKRPVIMIGFKDDCVIGEARAPKGFDLIQFLKACDEFFIDYGGHKCAAGFSVQPQDLSAAIDLLNETAAKFPPNFDLYRPTNAEVELALDEITPNLFVEMSKLSPFGEGNPAPLFLVKKVEIRKYYDGYRLENCRQSFWATRRVRQQLNFPIGVSVKGNVEFFIEDSGRGYISRFQTHDDESKGNQNDD